LPVVLSRAEVRAVLGHIRPPYRLMVELIYGSGLRLLECLRLRVHPVR
jgi:integrase